MIGFGCLGLIVLPLLGFFAGLWLGGPLVGAWCAGAGFVLAAALSVVMTYAMVKARA